MLKIDLRPGQSVVIGDVLVTVEEKSGQVTRLAIEADQAVRIERVRPPVALPPARTHSA